MRARKKESGDVSYSKHAFFIKMVMPHEIIVTLVPSSPSHKCLLLLRKRHYIILLLPGKASCATMRSETPLLPTSLVIPVAAAAEDCCKDPQSGKYVHRRCCLTHLTLKKKSSAQVHPQVKSLFQVQSWENHKDGHKCKQTELETCKFQKHPVVFAVWSQSIQIIF